MIRWRRNLKLYKRWFVSYWMAADLYQTSKPSLLQYYLSSPVLSKHSQQNYTKCTGIVLLLDVPLIYFSDGGMKENLFSSTIKGNTGWVVYLEMLTLWVKYFFNAFGLRQLTYVLLDIAIQELFPELNTVSRCWPWFHKDRVLTSTHPITIWTGLTFAGRQGPSDYSWLMTKSLKAAKPYHDMKLILYTINKYNSIISLIKYE